MLDAGTRGAHLLGECSLGRELDIQLAGHHLSLEIGVFSYVGGDHLFNLFIQ